jgi:lipopolysaccharide transport system ATP-binding protein
MVSIRARGLSVDFPLYHGSARSLKKRVLDRVGLRRDEQTKRLVVHALRGLDFDIGPGDRVALLGPNGAGKSTLLRTLLGIYPPVTGRLEMEGTVDGLIDPSAGLDMDATGYENVVLHCLMRGIAAARIATLTEEIAAFSELGDFLALPVRTYSAGMQLRLAFAIKTAIAPQILLMDEWFLAGDAGFMVKAEERLGELVARSEILVLATHDVSVATKWCNRAFQMKEGRLVS